MIEMKIYIPVSSKVKKVRYITLPGFNKVKSLLRLTGSIPEVINNSMVIYHKERILDKDYTFKMIITKAKYRTSFATISQVSMGDDKTKFVDITGGLVPLKGDLTLPVEITILPKKK